MQSQDPESGAESPTIIAASLRGLCLAGVLLIFGLVAAALRQLPPMPDSLGGEARVLEGCELGADGFLNGRLFGGMDRRIDWREDALSCDGIPRPEDRGARLFFGSRDEAVTLIIGIDSPIDTLAAREYSANITIIDGEAGAIYGSGGRDRCWTTIQAVTRRDPGSIKVNGVLYCAGAIPAIQGEGSVTLDEFRYAGLLRTENE